MPTHAKEIIKAFEKLESKRGVWESHWQSIADLALTSRQFTNTPTPGERRTRRQFDTTAAKAIVKLSSAMHGLLTNPSTQWFALRAKDDDLNEIPAVHRWLTESRNRMLNMFSNPSFGFNTQAHEVYLDLIAFGTSVSIFNEQANRIIFQARPLSESFLDADQDGRINTVYRKYEINIIDAEEFFGLENLSVNRRQQFSDGKDIEITVIHCVRPRRKRDAARRTPDNKPWQSVYVDLEEKEIIRESGFDDFPYLTPRWSKASGELYGRSPTMLLLPDIGMLSAMRKTTIVSAEQAVAPPYIVEASGIEGPLRIAPNSIIYKKQGFPDPIKPLITGNRVELGENLMDKERAGIKEGYFLDLLTLPEIDRMTTTEVLQRVQQRLVFMSPVLSRLIEEFLQPLVTRTYRAMARMDMFEEVPEELEGRPLDVDFVSVMAISQRASEQFNFQQWIGNMAPLAQVDPSILDIVNADEVARYAASTWHNVPGRLLRSPEEIAEIRQQKAEAAQAQAEAEAARQTAEVAEMGAKAVKQLSEVATE